MASAVHQLANASIAAVFSVGMLLAAHLFTEYRSARTPAIASRQPPVAALMVRSRFPFGNPASAIGRNDAI